MLNTFLNNCMPDNIDVVTAEHLLQVEGVV